MKPLLKTTKNKSIKPKGETKISPSAVIRELK